MCVRKCVMHCLNCNCAIILVVSIAFAIHIIELHQCCIFGSNNTVTVDYVVHMNRIRGMCAYVPSLCGQHSTLYMTCVVGVSVYSHVYLPGTPMLALAVMLDGGSSMY